MILPTPESRKRDTLRPDSPVVMYQKWRDLAFLHWAFPPDQIQETLPPGLHVDTFDGHAWIGLVPFEMRNIRPRFAPAIPPLSDIFEMNLRTYVYDDFGHTGVWFYSLDAASILAVKFARRFFHLNYLHSRFSVTKETSPRHITVDYTCRRTGSPENPAVNISYRAGGTSLTAAPESVEFFLLERYALYAYDHCRRRLFQARVYHEPYPFTPAELLTFDDNIFELNALPRPHRSPDSVLFSSGVDVNIYSLARLSSP